MRFFETLFEHKIDSQWLELRAFDPQMQKALSSLWIQDIHDPQIESFIADHVEHNIFFSVTSKTTQKRTTAAFGAAYFLWADLDNCTPAQYPAFGFPPTIIVNSGHGLHAYWRLIEPCSDGALVSQTTKAIGKIMGGDSVFDVVRILRIPGTHNYKYGDPPLPVEIVYYHPDVQYSILDLVHAVKLSAKTHKAINHSSAMEQPSRSEKDWGVLKDLYRTGISKEAMIHVMNYMPCGAKYREHSNPGHYLETSWDNAIEDVTKERKSPAKVSTGGEAGNITLVTEDSNSNSTSVAALKKHTLVTVQRIDVPEDSDESVSESEVVKIDTERCVFVRIIPNRKGGTRVIDLTSFSLALNYVLIGDTDIDDVYNCTICCKEADPQETEINIPKNAFNNAQSFKRAFRTAAHAFYGTDTDVQHIMTCISSQITPNTQRRYTVNKLGFHKGYWIGTNQVLMPNCDESVLDPLYRLYGDKNMIRTQYHEGAVSTDTIKAFVEAVFFINAPDIVYPLFGWWGASLFKSRLASSSDTLVRFPHLNVYGAKGSGKSATINILQQLSGVTTAAHVCNMTRYILMSVLSATEDVPVYLTEYRKSFIRNPDLIQYLLAAYDRGDDSRGTKDQRVNTAALTSPVIIDGEDALDDPALEDRCIRLNFSQSEMTLERKAAFAALLAVDIAAVGTDIIKFSLDKNIFQYLATAKTLCAEQPQMDLRVRNNIEVTLAGVLFLSDYFEKRIGAGITPDCGWFDLVVEQSTTNNLLVDTFVLDVVSHCDLHPDHRDFKHKHMDGILWFNLTDAISWWRAVRHNQQRDSMEIKGMKSQLRERENTYIIAPKTVRINMSSAWCYGVDIKQAIEFGLELPELDIYAHLQNALKD